MRRPVSIARCVLFLLLVVEMLIPAVARAQDASTGETDANYGNPIAPGPDGTVSGAFTAGLPNADVTGAMTQVLNFQFPPSRGAIHPSLGLSYNSSAGDREAGMGWGLTLPSINRVRPSGFPSYVDPPGHTTKAS